MRKRKQCGAQDYTLHTLRHDTYARAHPRHEIHIDCIAYVSVRTVRVQALIVVIDADNRT
jgi:hypothetical protein